MSSGTLSLFESDHQISSETLIWLKDNFIESIEDIKKIVSQALSNNSIEKLVESLQVIKRYYTDQDISLRRLINYLGKLAQKGIRGRQAALVLIDNNWINDGGKS